MSIDEIEYNGNNLLLIVTATDLETKCLHKHLEFYEPYEGILKINDKDSTYYLAKFGKYLAVHVQCGNMGSMSIKGSIITVNEAISKFNPKVTLMVGIAFGVDNKEQNIGDVLVSDCITPYNFKKINKGEEIIRTNDAPASRLLINKFQHAVTWEFLLESGKKAKKIIAPILSGEELINDVVRRDELVKQKPTAKGGEMEGAGLYAAAEGKTQWILVKGICDYADGNKDDNKDTNQETAMNSAVSLCLEVFSSLNSFESLDLFPIKSIVCSKLKADNALINRVLFDRYKSLEQEEYYHEREIDKNIVQTLGLFSIWIYGRSGRGKTSIAIRNIINEKLDYIFISLGSCNGLSVDQFFNEIYIDLYNRLEESEIGICDDSFKKTIQKIISLLEKHYGDTPVYIVIDEIPLGDETVFKGFTDRIFSLFISNSLNSQNTNIKYVLSSILSPKNHITSQNEKIHENVKFIEAEDWNTDNCQKLIEIITKGLNVHVEDESKTKLIKESDGSPRFIKNTFKTTFTLGDFNDDNFNKSILETKRILSK